VREKTSAGTKVREEGGGKRCSRCQTRDSPAARGADHSEAGCPLQPMEVHGGADLHLQPMEDLMPEQVDAPKGGCDPVGSPYWSRLLAGPVTPWETHAGAVCS